MRGRIRSRIDFLRFVYGSEWAYAIGFLGALLGFISTGLPTWMVIAAGTLTIVITLGLLIRDTRQLYERWSRIELYPNPAEFNSYRFKGVQWETAQTDSGFVGLGAAVIEGGEEQIWRSRDVDEALWNYAAQAPFVLEQSRYRLPERLREIAPQALLRMAQYKKDGTKRERPAIWFNGNLCRLSTEPTPRLLQGSSERAASDQGYEGRRTRPLNLQRVSYFDGQASNELWHWSLNGPIDAGGRARQGRRIPLEYAVDLDRRVLQLDYADMANIVGITLVAITSDDRVVMVKQSERNSVLPGGYTVSASGSLDWADVRRVAKRADGTPRLLDALMEGMLRELEEESQVRPDEVIPGSRRITGYFRWLSRGAKPEFTGLVRLAVSSATLQTRSVRGDEKLYTDGHAMLPAELLRQTPDDWSDRLAHVQPALGGSADRPVVIGASGVAAWFAAAEYLKANPDY